MSQTIQEERLRWVLPIVNKEIRLVDAAKVCPYGKRTLERWVAVYRKAGGKSSCAKINRTKTVSWRDLNSA